MLLGAEIEGEKAGARGSADDGAAVVGGWLKV